MLRLHYFHTKEILKRSRTQSGWMEKYQDVAVYADLLTFTLKRRAFHAIMEQLKSHRVVYHWGYFLKLLVHWEGKTMVWFTPEDLAKKLRDWGAEPMEQPRPAGAPRRFSPYWKWARRR
ncbi:Hypothetical predicted protein [Pelobates cultripes]|uniref:Uncharacterized protein n=1 Tax=Pelobates cultripes TaxID=61616 RepID=A0AAD1S1W3_PELCU|nr:Hypothetical predicted protein [Pelobates cultripes]